MPWQSRGQVISMKAASGVSSITWDSNHNYSSGGIAQFSAVKADASGAVIGDIVVATSNDLILGFLQDGPAVGGGMAASVQIAGITKARAKGAIAVGDQLYVGDSTGAVSTCPAAGQTSKNAVGVALTAATNDGDILSVLIQTGSQRVATA